MITYEYPCSEKVRTFLRLEELYERFEFFLAQKEAVQHHFALTTIFEILEVVGRADLKSDLLQELERQRQALLTFRDNPDVKQALLNDVIEDIEKISLKLNESSGKTGQTIRDNEWLMSIRGRTIIPGGACEFDLPAYYAWRRLPTEKRAKDIDAWFEPLRPLFGAISLILRLLRESGRTLSLVAKNGVYQQSPQGKMHQLMRVTLDSNLAVFPEISANKFVLMVRFMAQEGDQKPQAFERDVPFELTLCSF